MNDYVEELSDFVDSPSVHLRFQAQLINFKMDADSFDLLSGLMIRRLSEEEVSQHHGGPISTLGFVRPQALGPYEFAVEDEFDEQKLLGNIYPEGPTMSERAKAILDKVVLCLRTFKEGPVGYDYVHFTPTQFCPSASSLSAAGTSTSHSGAIRSANLTSSHWGHTPS